MSKNLELLCKVFWGDFLVNGRRWTEQAFARRQKESSLHLTVDGVVAMQKIDKFIRLVNSLGPLGL